MKPLQIGILVLVGAMGGALIMKFTQRKRPAPVPVASVAPAPAAQPVASPPAEPITEPVASAPPELSEVAHAPTSEEPERRPVRHARPANVSPVAKITPAKSVRTAKPAVTTVAQNLPPAAPPEQPAPAVSEPPAAAPEAPAPAAPAEPEANSSPVPEPVVTEPAQPEAPSVTLKTGLLLPVRLGQSLSSEHNQPGDAFTATLDSPLAIDGFVIAERGARLEGRVVEVQKASHVKGQAALAVVLTRLNTSDGQRIDIQTDTFRKLAARTSTTQNAEIIAAAAGVGAIIGAVAGGGKGAAIGGIAGGAAGTGGVMATRARAVALASETKISFRLREPVTITERASR